MAPTITRAQTIKQAKASYKARGRPTLTIAEKRQLERDAELERRASRVQESSKKRSEAAKKRAAAAKRDRELEAKFRLASQRRTDRFGYLCSQLHMGAFFTSVDSGGKGQRAREDASPPLWNEAETFGDDDVDDEALLELLKIHPSLATYPSAQAMQETSLTVDESSLWEDLDSSTQIQRDLAKDARSPRHECTRPSFDSDDFGSDLDLTVEDVEGPSLANEAGGRTDRKTMPPPALPISKAREKGAVVRFAPPVTNPQSPASVVRPPLGPVKQQDQAQPRAASTSNGAQVPRHSGSQPPGAYMASHACASKIGLTLAELEDFVDDDLRLTQANPG